MHCKKHISTVPIGEGGLFRVGSRFLTLESAAFRTLMWLLLLGESPVSKFFTFNDFFFHSLSLFWTSSVQQGFFPPSSVSSAPMLASITETLLLRADTILAFTEGHFPQKNSGLCLCMTQSCLGTHRGCESHMMPSSCSCSVLIPSASAEGHHKIKNDF